VNVVEKRDEVINYYYKKLKQLHKRAFPELTVGQVISKAIEYNNSFYKEELTDIADMTEEELLKLFETFADDYIEKKNTQVEEVEDEEKVEE
jgi:hypothetical protein